MGSATPTLWSLGASESQSASINIQLRADVDSNEFCITVWSQDERRRSSRTKNVKVPEGGDLGDLGRVCRDIVEHWLWDPTFAPAVAVMLAVGRYYAQD